MCEKNKKSVLFVNMFRKIKDWFKQERIMRSLSNLSTYQDARDPRELPRPERYLAKNFTASSNIIKETNDHNTTEENLCNCKNCREFSDSFSECIVCMEPLQSAAISSCMFCGNYTCWSCSDKMSQCPFCRANFQSNENRIRNFALERILLKMELPCRHSRWGCRMQLNYKERPSHESSCSFAPTGCPLVKMCGWHGDSTDIVRHLKDTHDMTLIAANGINVEIADFRMKLLNTISIPRLYTVSLTCHGNIYICKLRMQNQTLRVIFFQITGETSERNKRYAACLEITASSRTLKGMVEISPNYKSNKEIVIPGQALIYNQKENDDLVNINITIKPLN